MKQNTTTHCPSPLLRIDYCCLQQKLLLFCYLTKLKKRMSGTTSSTTILKMLFYPC